MTQRAMNSGRVAPQPPIVGRRPLSAAAAVKHVPLTPYPRGTDHALPVRESLETLKLEVDPLITHQQRHTRFEHHVVMPQLGVSLVVQKDVARFITKERTRVNSFEAHISAVEDERQARCTLVALDPHNVPKAVMDRSPFLQHLRRKAMDKMKDDVPIMDAAAHDGAIQSIITRTESIVLRDFEQFVSNRDSSGSVYMSLSDVERKKLFVAFINSRRATEDPSMTTFTRFSSADSKRRPVPPSSVPHSARSSTSTCQFVPVGRPRTTGTNDDAKNVCSLDDLAPPSQLSVPAAVVINPLQPFRPMMVTPVEERPTPRMDPLSKRDYVARLVRRASAPTTRCPALSLEKTTQPSFEETATGTPSPLCIPTSLTATAVPRATARSAPGSASTQRSRIATLKHVENVKACHVAIRNAAERHVEGVQLGSVKVSARQVAYQVRLRHRRNASLPSSVLQRRTLPEVCQQFNEFVES